MGGERDRLVGNSGSLRQTATLQSKREREREEGREGGEREREREVGGNRREGGVG